MLQPWATGSAVKEAPAINQSNYTPSTPFLQHSLNQLEVPTMERVHGDVPFLGTAESIRCELQQYPGPNAVNTPHQCLAFPTLLYGRRQRIMLQPWAKCIQG
jgi:hypothetical protein